MKSCSEAPTTLAFWNISGTLIMAAIEEDLTKSSITLDKSPILKELYNHQADLSIKNKAGNSAIKLIPEKIMTQLKKG